MDGGLGIGPGIGIWSKLSVKLASLWLLTVMGIAALPNRSAASREPPAMSKTPTARIANELLTILPFLICRLSEQVISQTCLSPHFGMIGQ